MRLSFVNAPRRFDCEADCVIRASVGSRRLNRMLKNPIRRVKFHRLYQQTRHPDETTASVILHKTKVKWKSSDAFRKRSLILGVCISLAVALLFSILIIKFSNC